MYFSDNRVQVLRSPILYLDKYCSREWRQLRANSRNPNNKNTILQYTTLYYSTSKRATSFGCTRQPSSAQEYEEKLYNCSYG